MSSLPAPPRYIRWINDIGGVLENLHFVKPELRAERLISHAQRKTGLCDWGDASFRPGLEHLVLALNAQARLTQVGRIVAYFNLLDQLCVRLRMIDYRKRRPQVARQYIRQPLFIVGLPRTGTTILYELLAQDPAIRSPATWEVTRPFPPPTAGHYHTDKRIAAVERLLTLLEQLSPGFKAIHASGAILPQECVYLLASAFVSEQYGYMYNVPEYRAWALDQDMTASYRWHAQFLQHLQMAFSRERWVLKTPAHLGSLQYLLAQYPDASIVWTHRRPLAALASFSSLTFNLRSAFCDGVDPMATGEQEVQHFSKVVQKGIEDRQSLDTGQFIDVSFETICRDPMAAISSIYQHFAMTFTPQAEERMREYLRRRPRYLYGEHRYSPQAFGLSDDQERMLYGGYLSQYEQFL